MMQLGATPLNTFSAAGASLGGGATGHQGGSGSPGVSSAGTHSTQTTQELTIPNDVSVYHRKFSFNAIDKYNFYRSSLQLTSLKMVENKILKNYIDAYLIVSFKLRSNFGFCIIFISQENKSKKHVELKTKHKN